MTVYVITHKPFDYPLPTGYQPILVGADKNANPNHYQPDNEGINISDKNPSFCELTGLYWLWKHAEDEKLGLVHYRRYFSKYNRRGQMYFATLAKGAVRPIEVAALDKLLADYDWVVAEPEAGGAGSLTEQFDFYHNRRDLEVTRQVIAELSPAVLPDFDRMMEQHESSFYNMFYTSRTEMNVYCEWLFKILFEVEKRTDISSYDSYQQRLYGFLGERLLNVWLLHRQAKVKYLAEYQTDQLNRAYAWEHVMNKIQRKLGQAK